VKEKKDRSSGVRLNETRPAAWQSDRGQRGTGRRGRPSLDAPRSRITHSHSLVATPFLFSAPGSSFAPLSPQQYRSLSFVPLSILILSCRIFPFCLSPYESRPHSSSFNCPLRISLSNSRRRHFFVQLYR
jgi:hypothetical protein